MVSAHLEQRHMSDSITRDEAHQGAAAYLQSRLAVQSDELDKDFDIPVIDLTPSFSTDHEDKVAVAMQIRRACLTSGFFYIANHRVTKAARDGILKQADKFFNTLSTEQKDELHVKKSQLGLGWEPSEYTSIAGDQEKKEGFNFAYEEALDPSGGDGLYRNLDGTSYNGNMWPKEQDVPGFHDAIKQYYGAVCYWCAML